MPYSTDADLDVRRNGFSALFPSGTASVRAQAEADMLEDIELLWYRPAAEAKGYDWRSTAFDSSLIEATQLKRLSVLKTLEVGHGHLMQVGSDPTGYERHRELYAKEYRELLQQMCSAGLDYDWDESGDISSDEVAGPRKQLRLVRA